MPFLADHELRPLTLAEDRGLRPLGLILASGPSALEVALTETDRRPTSTTLRSVWKSRHRGRAAPLLLIALYDNKAALCGPAGDDPPAYIDLDSGQVERLCATALSEPVPATQDGANDGGNGRRRRVDHRADAVPIRHSGQHPVDRMGVAVSGPEDQSAVQVGSGADLGIHPGARCAL